MLFEPMLIGALALVATPDGIRAGSTAARLARANIRAVEGRVDSSGRVAAMAWPARYRDDGDYVAHCMLATTMIDQPADAAVIEAFDAFVSRYPGWNRSLDRRALCGARSGRL